MTTVQANTIIAADCTNAYADFATSVQDWATQPEAVALISALERLNAATLEIQALRTANPKLHALVDAEGSVGRVAVQYNRQAYGRGLDAVLAPSNGACAISVLWDVLDGMRSAVIEKQLRAEGLDVPGVITNASEASFDRRDELDRLAPSVGATLFLGTAGEA